MASLLIAGVVVVALILIVLLLPRIRDRIAQHRQEQDKSTPLYQCKLAKKGGQPGSAGSDDVYDCVKVGSAPEDETPRQ
ncbi:MAG: hypothetical protein HPY61_11395 [Methanotrichaceae archaeon]|nr:hypothetical protein [Methanotrichaceae archaeon]